jgi:NHLM bacteriocin system ABC transporter peptidase/ATP-binding protein
MSDTSTEARIPSRVRKAVPSILQLEVTECGAASLGMVMARFGKFIPLDELRVRCGVSRDGSNAKNLLLAAREYGLKAKAFKRDPADLKSMEFPLIVHWRFYHFLVVEGYDRNGWILNDPALGPRHCDQEEFDECFTGIVIDLKPGPDFVREGKRPGVVGRLFNAAGSMRAALAIAILTAVLLVVPTIAVPQFIQLYGEHLSSGAGLIASIAVVGLLAAAVIQAILLLLQGALSVRLATKISLRLSSAMVYQLLRLPASFHAQRGASVLAQRALLADQLSTGVSAITIGAASGAILSTIAAIVLLAFDPVSGILVIILALVIALVLRQTLIKSRDQATQVIRETVEAGAVMSASLSQIESIKASGSEDGIISRGLSAENRLLEAQQRIGQRSLRLTLLPGFLGTLAVILVTCTAALRVRDGSLEPGTILAVIALAGIVIGPLQGVVVALDSVQTLRPALDQVDDVLVSPEDPELSTTHAGDVPATIRGELELRNVSFGYSAISPPLLEGLNLTIKPGHRVALVGPSGCGKSTVSRLVTGLYAPWEGEVLVDGLPRSEHNRDVLAQGLALVDQDVTIFAGTIRENVTLWDPLVPERDVIAAIDDAQLGADIARRAGGLDAVLEEGGADLSGGQRQRLEIARALVRNPRILVMDEATSSLDPITEQRIDEAVRRRGITCLVIAHRLSTIRDSDEIIVLDKGVVVERGTHDELMSLNGAYATLVGSA